MEKIMEVLVNFTDGSLYILSGQYISHCWVISQSKIVKEQITLI